MYKHLSKPSLDFTFRRLLLILEIVGMNPIRIDNLKEGLTEVFGYEVYEMWWSKHSKDPNVGDKSGGGYQQQASVIVQAESLLGSWGGVGVSADAVVQAYFNGTLTWKRPDPQDHLTLGVKKKKWSWPQQWR